jgi:hypothetical protein
MILLPWQAKGEREERSDILPQQGLNDPFLIPGIEAPLQSDPGVIPSLLALFPGPFSIMLKIEARLINACAGDARLLLVTAAEDGSGRMSSDVF